jgi:Protein of unknown function (DUF533)
MDAIDILGALLGRKGQPGGASGQSRMGGGAAGGKAASPAPSQRQRPLTVDEAAHSLEDILGVAKSRQPDRAPAPVPTPVPAQVPAPAPQRTPSQPTSSVPSGRASLPNRELIPAAMNEQAKVLIRAMIAATKSDGQVSDEEQNAIVKQCGQLSDADVAFLREEFARPIDVKELAWSIPLGMEEQAYAISLMAIELDEQSEAEYLGELAHGLRLQPSRCNEIHRKHGAPEIFR